jgi:hypothetical protein
MQRRRDVQRKTLQTIAGATVFAVAMGFIEAAVVIYLREIYYPAGFKFPLQAIAGDIARVELLRELATMIMLLSAGLLAGRTRYEKGAYFIYCFGVWDLFYYVFLKLLVGWPDSLLTWDILFLIPTIWTGPVLAPCMNSFAMIAVAYVIFYSVDKHRLTGFGPAVWSLFIAGAVIILISYLQGSVQHMARHVGYSQFVGAFCAGKAAALAWTYVPSRFNWPLFSAGTALHLAALALYCRSAFRRG